MKLGLPSLRLYGTQSENYRGIFDNYGGSCGKISDIYRGHYVSELEILNVKMP